MARPRTRLFLVLACVGMAARGERHRQQAVKTARMLILMMLMKLISCPRRTRVIEEGGGEHAVGVMFYLFCVL